MNKYITPHWPGWVTVSGYKTIFTAEDAIKKLRANGLGPQEAVGPVYYTIRVVQADAPKARKVLKSTSEK